ncbi:MAG: hypothetical protein HY716_07145 [Planctomycetes bacterium]|nr:hypothetical protein [Planctomycetota bacterium]
MRPKLIPDPARVRAIRGSFGWIDHRLLRDGHLERMGLPEMALYLFLVLAADRFGVSYYRKEHICKALGISEEEFHHARDRLVVKRLVAFHPFRPGDVNGYVQLLPLDECSENLRG